MGTQTVRTNQFNWGPAEIEFGGNVLGATKGGVTVTITTDWQNITVDAYGSAPLDAFEKGTSITVVCRLAESDRFETLMDALPAGTRSGRTLQFGRTAGVTTPTKKKLIVKPVESGGRWLTVYNAAATAEPITLEYNNEDIRLLEVTFNGFIDTTRNDGDRLFNIGGPFS